MITGPPHYDPSLDLEARPSSPEGSGGVASGCSNGAECSVVEDEASIKNVQSRIFPGFLLSDAMQNNLESVHILKKKPVHFDNSNFSIFRCT